MWARRAFCRIVTSMMLAAVRRSPLSAAVLAARKTSEARRVDSLSSSLGLQQPSPNSKSTCEQARQCMHVLYDRARGEPSLQILRSIDDGVACRMWFTATTYKAQSCWRSGCAMRELRIEFRAVWVQCRQRI